VEKGTPEYQFASALEVNKPRSKEDLDKTLGKELAKIGFSKAMKRKWVQLDPADKNSVVRIAEALEDTERDQLRKYVDNNDLEQHDKKVVDQLKKRKLLNVVSQKYYKVTKGENF